VTTADAPVSDVMSIVVFGARPETSVGELRTAMHEQGLHFVPVVEDHVPVGVVSSWDLMRCPSDNRLVSEMMTTPPISIAPTTTIREAAVKMRYAAVHHLLVVRDGRLVGSVSAIDLLQAVDA